MKLNTDVFIKKTRRESFDSEGQKMLRACSAYWMYAVAAADADREQRDAGCPA